MVTSRRMSSRYFAYEILSRSSTRRSSSGVTLFSCAMRRIVRSTVWSSTRTPLSLANCSSARSTISRSSTCPSRTSGAGGRTFDAFICASTMRFCSSSSYCVSASSLTTARTRSSGTVAVAARGGAAGRAGGGVPGRGPAPGTWMLPPEDVGWAEASAATPAAATAASSDRTGRRRAIAGTPSRTRAADRSCGRAAAAWGRWCAGSPEPCVAGAPGGSCPRAPGRSARAARTANASWSRSW